MTTIEINNTMTGQEEKELKLDAHPAFKIKTETSDKAVATVGNLATVVIRGNHFENDLEERKETAADIINPLTNIQVMQALTLMTYKKENNLDKLPLYVAEFETSLKSGEPMEFFPLIKNEEELREHLSEQFALNKIPRYVDEFAAALKSDELIIKNDEELREYLAGELASGAKRGLDKYFDKYRDQFIYSALGALFLNL